MILFPNAKINIGLDVTHKRSDGYHELSTVMVPVPLYDILEIVDCGGNSGETFLFVSGNNVNCPTEKNLVFRAASLLREEYGFKNKIEIYLRKIIPDGAGMGGGSSDAAFTLKGINEILSLSIPDERLEEIASRIGADCPFFIKNVPQLAKGIGEKLTPIKIPELSGKNIIIIKPPQTISTKEAYSNIRPFIPEIDLELLIQEPLNRWSGLIKNDFEEVIFKFHPALKGIKDELRDQGAIYGSMTGSGSAFYGIFPENTDNLTAKFKLKLPGDYKFYEGTLKF